MTRPTRSGILISLKLKVEINTREHEAGTEPNNIRSKLIKGPDMTVSTPDSIRVLVFRRYEILKLSV